MPPERRAHTLELNNVIINVTSAPFFHLLFRRSAILAQVAYGDMEQTEMVVTIHAERKEYLATAFRAIRHRHTQGSLIGRFYRVSGIQRTFKPVGESRRYFLDASSITDYHASNIPANLYRGLGIVDFSTPRRIRRALRNPALPRVQ